MVGAASSSGADNSVGDIERCDIAQERADLRGVVAGWECNLHWLARLSVRQHVLRKPEREMINDSMGVGWWQSSYYKGLSAQWDRRPAYPLDHHRDLRSSVFHQL